MIKSGESAFQPHLEVEDRVKREGNKRKKGKRKSKARQSKRGKRKGMKNQNKKRNKKKKGKGGKNRKSNINRKLNRKMGQRKKMMKDRALTPSGRKVMRGSHCEYIDLCELDRMAADGCNSGQKFVIKVRRITS